MGYYLYPYLGSLFSASQGQLTAPVPGGCHVLNCCPNVFFILQFLTTRVTENWPMHLVTCTSSPEGIVVAFFLILVILFVQLCEESVVIGLFVGLAAL